MFSISIKQHIYTATTFIFCIKFSLISFFLAEDAKCKWRSLINYLRHHLDSVAQKKIRRYIPNTENPEDKYVQLTDWQYYSEMEFIVPYVKYSSKQDPNTGKSAMEMLPSEIDMIIEGIENDVDHKKEHEETQTPNTEELSGEGDPKDKVDKLIQLVSNDDLTEDDEILKEYFENMLKTTLNLPRFHQNRIKQKLLDTVNECE